MTSLAQRLQAVDDRIASQLRRSGRSDQITRIVVSKFHPASLVRELNTLGVRDFGENRDQEAQPKAAELGELDLHWHFVGQLQSNKAKSVVTYAQTLHSLDRQSLLDALVKVTGEQAQPLEVFIQVNLTADPNRGGIELGALRAFGEQVAAHKGLRLMGVMAVASLDGEEERDFAKIAAASQLISTDHPEARYISAGMSGDFELAIEYGATHLRIGTAITGNRPVTAYPETDS